MVVCPPVCILAIKGKEAKSNQRNEGAHHFRSWGGHKIYLPWYLALALDSSLETIRHVKER